MKITIVGGGNIGTQFAIHCSQENNVTIFTSTPECFIKNARIIDENNNTILEGKNIKATNKLDAAFSEADLIFITYPAFSMDELARKIVPYARKGLKIGIVPGTGGGECAFNDAIRKGATVFGLQRVPSVARLVEKGKCVRAIGYRNELFVASLPNIEKESIAKIIESIFKINCTALPNYLNLTLTPSNPILHTTRLRTIFKNYKNGKVYESLPLFYEEWDDDTSKLLFKCDDEVQNICKAIKQFDLSYVKSLKEHYDSETPQKLTAKIRSIDGFKGLTTPSIKVENGVIPDFNSRYFTADFSYGLSILIQIGEMFGLNIKNMSETMKWYRSVSNDIKEFSFKNYNIKNTADFIKFYGK